VGSYLTHGPEIYPKAHENPRAFSCISGPIYLESSIQCPYGVGLHRFDYQDTFAPVTKLNTVRVLLSLAANEDWPFLQFDEKNTFLHGDLMEEVYMDPPPGIPKYSNIPLVCKLKKAFPF